MKAGGLWGCFDCSILRGRAEKQAPTRRHASDGRFVISSTSIPFHCEEKRTRPSVVSVEAASYCESVDSPEDVSLPAGGLALRRWRGDGLGKGPTRGKARTGARTGEDRGRQRGDAAHVPDGGSPQKLGPLFGPCSVPRIRNWKV